jgi:hypothetical protein
MRAHVVGMLAALLATSGLTGCGWQSGGGAATSGGGAVAVIDLDEIARRLGSDRQIVQSVSQRQTALQKKLQELAQSYVQQIEDQRKTLPAEQAEQADVTVASWQQQANANLTQVKRQAEADLVSHRSRLMEQFREQVKPVARLVAQRRGLGVIVTKNDSVVFDYVSTADITAEVVDELLAHAAAAPTPVATQASPVSAAPAPAASAPQQAARPAGADAPTQR